MVEVLICATDFIRCTSCSDVIFLILASSYVPFITAHDFPKFIGLIKIIELKK